MIDKGNGTLTSDEEALKEITHYAKTRTPGDEVFNSAIKGILAKYKKSILSLRYWRIDADKGTVKLVECERCKDKGIRQQLSSKPSDSWPKAQEKVKGL